MRVAPRTGVQRLSSGAQKLSIMVGMGRVLEYLLRWCDMVSAEMRASLEPARD
jgi:hypothetical protein